LQEPSYYATYGYDLFQWSYYSDKYNIEHKQEDLAQANKYRDMIPQSVRDEFVWRRNRNHEITLAMLETQFQNKLFDKIYITLDDSANYGFNKAEERQLRDFISKKGLWNCTYMYPGADEVALTMLSNAVLLNQKAPKNRVRVVYRVPSAKDYIPNYEGQPLHLSVLMQITAAGGQYVSEMNMCDVIVLVNNFNTSRQQEAPDPQTNADYSPFLAHINYAISNNKTIVFADVRYSNGGDLFFVEWVYDLTIGPKLGSFSYAGWNTAGNTLGTCISNGMLLAQFSTSVQALEANKLFTVYRFLEDARYQAYVRQQLANYVVNVAMGNTNRLDDDLQFHIKFVENGLNAELKNQIKKAYPYDLDQVQVVTLFFPWNRVFEIGFQLKKGT
jgi:hypothetical protein